MERLPPETVCEVNLYFANVRGGLNENLRTTHILSCFQGSIVHDWAAANFDTLAVLDFPDFILAFQEHFLPKDWENTIKEHILGTRLDPTKECFETWAHCLQKLNVML
jgi:hypothetical protein